jgi:hypothetical protein
MQGVYGVREAGDMAWRVERAIRGVARDLRMIAWDRKECEEVSC